MIDYIQDIIARFGGRYFGSQQEKDAQYYTADVLKKYCDKVVVEEFQSPLESHFQSLKIFCIVYVLVLVLLKFNIQFAAFLGILNSILFLGHFVTYRHWLDFLFKKVPSWNVIGDIEPTETATSTVIVAGHIDSVKEFKWWYKLKQTGAVLSVIAGVQIALLGIYALLSLIITATWFGYIWWLFLVATPILIVFFDMHGTDVVDGASDNLTGVAMAVEMAKVFSSNRLTNTRLRLISFGSEEAALRGSHAYAQTHKQQLLAENAFLFNLDSIKDIEHLTIATSETNTLVYYEKQYIKLVEDAFIASSVPYKKLALHVGASDGTSFHIAGLPVATVIGMDSEKLDPIYHTRLDKIEAINPAALSAMKKVLIKFIETWDQKN